MKPLTNILGIGTFMLTLFSCGNNQNQYQSIKGIPISVSGMSYGMGDGRVLTFLNADGRTVFARAITSVNKLLKQLH